MGRYRLSLQITTLILLFMCSSFAMGQRTSVRAIYIPLADHYAAIVAYEKYRHEMKQAKFELLRMKNWDLLRAYFMSGDVDMAFVMSPLAMDMFREKEMFRWVGQMHRDGNALAINELVNKRVHLPTKRLDRKPDRSVADAFTNIRTQTGKPIQVGVPHLLATHSVVLYKYLKEHGKTLGIGSGLKQDAVIISVAPPKAPSFIKKQNNRGISAAFEQSLPWADVVETGKYGYVAWYSKDVMNWPLGHVECIALATDVAIANKREAIQEVIYFIHKAGLDIEAARQLGGGAMIKITDMVRKHIPEHNQDAIIQSLRADLNVINYKNLNVEPEGIKMIMDLAVEGGILKSPININAFTDDSFSTSITTR